MFPVYEEKKENLHLHSRIARHESPHLHNSVEFIYLTEGCLELGMGQELFHMEEGDFAVLFPEVIHHCQVFSGENNKAYITQVAVGKLKELGVFGNDYDTPDGTGVRDYIHVVDLAKGHVKALKKIEENPGLAIYNLGTGKGYSVLDIVKNFEAATGVKIPYVIKPRRAGDIATCYCDASKAEKELGWKAENGIREMCEDSWRWQSDNPQGYEE